jgi:O-antigen ligase
MLVWAPLLLGSNRAIFWSLNGFAGAIALLCFLASEWKTRRSSVSNWNIPLQVLLLIALPVIWMLVQIMPGLPASLLHPVWADVPRASGRMTINPHQTEIAIMWWLTLSVVFIAVRAGTNRGKVEVFMNLMLLMVLVVAAFGLANEYFDWETIGIERKTAYIGWLTGTFVNRNSAASFFAIGMVIATTLALRAHATIDERFSESSRLAGTFQILNSRMSVYAGLAIVIFTALLLTGSRAGIASALLGTFLVICLAPKLRQRNSLFIPAIAGLSLIAISMNALLERAHTAPESSLVRINLYREAINAILDRPFIGHGGGTYQSVEPLYHLPETSSEFIWNHAHSSYLEAAVGLGLPVTLMWLALAGALVFKVYRANKLAQRLLPATVATIAIFVAEGLHALVDFSLQVQAVALYLACLLGLSIGEVMASAVSYAPTNQMGTNNL